MISQESSDTIQGCGSHVAISNSNTINNNNNPNHYGNQKQRTLCRTSQFSVPNSNTHPLSSSTESITEISIIPNHQESPNDNSNESLPEGFCKQKILLNQNIYVDLPEEELEDIENSKEEDQQLSPKVKTISFYFCKAYLCVLDILFIIYRYEHLDFLLKLVFYMFKCSYYTRFVFCVLMFLFFH